MMKLKRQYSNADMRIIGGQFRSRQIRFPKSKRTRPITDRAKESIFGILGDTPRDAEVLDLFAGSGSFGIESLSRGAKHVRFVELDMTACRVIRLNLTTLNLREAADVYQANVERMIRLFSRKGNRFDLVFLDPPYNKGLIKKTLHQLDRFGIVKKFGKVLVHRARQEGLPEELESLRFEREKPLGQAFLSFYFNVMNGKHKEISQDSNG